MKTTKKLIVLCLVAVMGVVAVMPSTFSWYAHNGNVGYAGNDISLSVRQFVGDGETKGFHLGNLVSSVSGVKINGTENNAYTFDSDTKVITFTSAPASDSKIEVSCTYTVPLSLQQASTNNQSAITMTTYQADRYNKKGSALASNSDFESIGRNSTSRYITTLKNNGAKDISVNLEMSKLTNNANVFVGTCDPVVNERSFAARATLEKVDWDYEVIYFEPRTHYDWWKQGVGDSQTNVLSAYRSEQGISYGADSVTDNYDINLEYQIGTDGYPMAMQKCPYQDHVGNNNYDVYRAFVTTEADSLFFFNHYYITENTNLEWNRTPTVNDFAEGRVYYLNGNTNSYNNKDISYHDSFNGSNICVYYYYKTATMAAGKTANLGLKKGTSDMVVNREEFDYTGKSISYSSSNTSVATVSQDGLVTAKASGDTTITTTITGEFGDTVSLPTTVNIPEYIDQVPIVQNVKIPAGETVDITWYVRNQSSGNASFKNIFVTV